MANIAVDEERDFNVLAVKEVNSSYLTSGPFPVLIIIAAYLLFVMKIGPIMMKNRKPFNINSIMLIYNLYQVAFNIHLASKMFHNRNYIPYLWKHACVPANPSTNELTLLVFMVLKKKFNQLSYLHIYHHASMVLWMWLYLKYIRGKFSKMIYHLWRNSINGLRYTWPIMDANYDPKLMKLNWSNIPVKC